MSIQVRSNETPVTQPEVAKPAEGGTAASSQATNPAPEAQVESTEQKESLDSGTEGEEAEEQVADESAEPKSEEEAGKPEDAANKSKKKGGFQKRIDKLNARVSAREQELDYWKSLALKQGTGEVKKETVDPKPAASDGKPNLDSFDTHSAYVEALTDWKTDQKLKERDQNLEKSRLASAQDAIAKSYSDRAKAFAVKSPDFDEVLAEVDDIFISPTVREIILTSDHGPELAYELAKDREEFARVCSLSPLAAARELGKVESRLGPKTSESKQELRKLTNAPKPIDPVNAGGKGTMKKSITDPSLSQSEYEQLRREQMKKRRQA